MNPSFLLFICEAATSILLCVNKVPVISLDDAQALIDLVTNSIMPTASQKLIVTAIDDKVMKNRNI